MIPVPHEVDNWAYVKNKNISCLTNIRIFEYKDYMIEAIQEFKAAVFSALSHPTRIAIVEQLRNGELTAGMILQRLGLPQANASQHLAILRAKQIVVNRKIGNQVFYSLRNPHVIEVLDAMRSYIEAQLEQTLLLLKGHQSKI